MKLPSLIAGVAVAVGFVLTQLPAPMGVDPRVMGGAGIAVVAIGLWATGAIAEWLTALILFAMAMLLRIAPASVVFSGFQATALWLVIGGLIVGVAIGKTGLGARMARGVVPYFGRSYLGIIAGIVAVGVGLGFLVPSSLGRIVMLMPIMLALADGYGFAPGSNGRAGMTIACGLGTFILPFSILPASVPPMVMVGLAEKLYGWVPLYGEYLLLHFPVLGFLKALCLIGLIAWLLPDAPRGSEISVPPATPMSAEERRLALIVGTSLLLWATDFLHHISPAWISLAAGIACVAPGFGVVSAQEAQTKVNWSSALYIAGMLSLGTIVADTGVADVLARAFLGAVALEPGAHATTFAVVAGMTSILSMATTQPGIPAVMTPLAGEIAKASGLPVSAVLMMEVIGFSTLLLPYQGPPLVVALQMGGVGAATAARVTLALAATVALVLAPIDYAWWLLLDAFR